MENQLPEGRADRITHLQRLWQSSPGDYWPAFRASGLSAKDVWPNDAVENAIVTLERPETSTPPSKRKGAKGKAEPQKEPLEELQGD